MSDIFREIDDELRRENLLQLWSRYSRYIIAGVVVLALIAAGIFAWRQHLASEQLAVRAVVVHAIDQRAARFYEHFGFRALSSRPRTLMVVKGFSPFFVRQLTSAEQAEYAAVSQQVVRRLEAALT